MLLCSKYVLNQLREPNCITIYPYAHESTNLHEHDKQARAVTIPDVAPNALPLDSDFSMAAGEFIESFGGDANAWDCVASCFFLDTAHNVLEYLECIAHILKPGGCLINIGPLLYHYSDAREELSIDLAWDEIKMALPHLGLRLVLEQRRDCQYACNPHSMFSVRYSSVFFVAVKDA